MVLSVFHITQYQMEGRLVNNKLERKQKTVMA
jgi:hypothetical protein